MTLRLIAFAGLALACGQRATTPTESNEDGGVPTPAFPEPVSTLCPAPAPATLVDCVSFERYVTRTRVVDRRAIDESFAETDVRHARFVSESNRLPVVQKEGRFGKTLTGPMTIPMPPWGGQPITVEFWAKPGAKIEWGRGPKNEPASGILFQYQTNGLAFAAGAHVAVTPATTNGEWVHLAGVFNPLEKHYALYVNGERAYYGSHLFKGYPFTLPADAPLEVTQGFVDELMIWNEERTPEQLCADSGGTSSMGRCTYSVGVGMKPDLCAIDPADIPTTTGSTNVEPLLTQAEQVVADYQAANAGATEAEAWAYVGHSAFLSFSAGMANRYRFGCAAFERAYRLAPTDARHQQNMSMCMYLLAVRQNRTGVEHGAALSLARCVVQKNPNSGSALATLGAALVVTDALAEATSTYLRATEVDPNNPEWAYQAWRLAGRSIVDSDTLQPLLLDRMRAAEGFHDGFHGFSSEKGAPDAGMSGGYCCRCGTPTSYSSFGECSANCQTGLSCFTQVCAFTNNCSSSPILCALPFSISLCYPPLGAHACIGVSEACGLTLTVGLSLGPLLSVSAGVEVNVLNVGSVALTVEASNGTTSVSLARDLKTGALTAAASRQGPVGTSFGLAEVALPF